MRILLKMCVVFVLVAGSFTVAGCGKASKSVSMMTCDEFYTDGADVSNVKLMGNSPVCRDGKSTEVIGFASFECSDGTVLAYTDRGWWRAGTMHTWPTEKHEPTMADVKTCQGR